MGNLVTKFVRKLVDPDPDLVVKETHVLVGGYDGNQDLNKNAEAN